MGVFNGILTGQCSEITLVSNDEEHAVCNLASICVNKFVKPFKSERIWIIYTKENCKYCKWAKNYMDHNKFDYIIKEQSPENIEFLRTHKNNSMNNSNDCVDGACSYNAQKAKLTYPQIYYGDLYIGGFSDMIQFTAADYNFQELWETAYIATINLDHVIDKNYYPTPETRCSNIRNRPLGLGIQGLADTLIAMKTPFESDMAVRFNKHMMEIIYHASLTASMNIAHSRHDDMKEFIEYYNQYQIEIPEYYEKTFKLDNEKINEIYHKHNINKCEMKLTSHFGAYSSYNGSPLSKGLLQFDLWKEDSSDNSICNWGNIRDGINEYGVRNSLLVALMPTASTSQIMGNNECFEWFTNNIYTRRTLAGDFPIVNKHLVNDLLAIGEWNEEIKQIIIASDGNVNNLDIPPTYKELYKTIWDIKQIWVLKHARARAPYVDQTQSMNIFMAVPDYNKLLNCHMWAWKNGLKTGMYYLRTKPSEGAIKVTVDPTLQKKLDNNESCESCSA
jgi:ribonucleotide reductase alpha subunit